MANAPAPKLKTVAKPAAAWAPPRAPPHHPLPPAMPQRWASAYGEDEHGLWQAFEAAGVRQVMRWIPPGEFSMGSPNDEPERYKDETLHHVVLTQGYWLADTACTQALWEAVLGENPSEFKGDRENPVERVSWRDITERFLPELNRRVPGLAAELPTEAQWEYACRAGTESPFWFGEQITPEQVNYDGNFPYHGGKKGLYRQKTVGVKALGPANGWGLWQMHGNVWEWCADEYGGYPEGEVVDPKGPQGAQGEEGAAGGRQRLLRGGGWLDSGRYCRSANRSAYAPDDRSLSIGFRLARGPC
jgi:formylglycine-generating enzyme